MPQNPVPGSGPLTSETVTRLRAELPALATSCYLNTGTLGPSPRRVTEKLFETYRRWQEAGPGDPDVYHQAAAEAVSAKTEIGAFLGVAGEDLALTGNSTDGINLVAGGIQWKAGDEVIISDQEHPAGLLIWLHLRKTKGVRPRIARLRPQEWTGIVEEVTALVNSRTRLVAMSHVSCMTGFRLPAAEITRAAHERGVRVLFDGAQAAGQEAVNLREIGCDYYAVNGHKWLLGPVGTGALYVSPEAAGDLAPDRVGAGSADRWDYAEDGNIVLKSGGSRFEFGTRLYSLYPAWAEALSFVKAADPRAAWERAGRLAGRLRRGLSDLRKFGVEIAGPTEDHPELVSSLVSFRVSGLDGEVLYRRLKDEFGVISRPVSELGATRFSVAFFNTEEEIDLAVGAVEAVAREGTA